VCFCAKKISSNLKFRKLQISSRFYSELCPKTAQTHLKIDIIRPCHGNSSVSTVIDLIERDGKFCSGISHNFNESCGTNGFMFLMKDLAVQRNFWIGLSCVRYAEL